MHYIRLKREETSHSCDSNWIIFYIQTFSDSCCQQGCIPQGSEADVFYDNVRMQFMSTMISTDEILWKFLLSLGAHQMIKAMCKVERATYV